MTVTTATTTAVRITAAIERDPHETDMISIPGELDFPGIVRFLGMLGLDGLHPLRNLRSLPGMCALKTLQAASGWLDLGLADEALLELESLPTEEKTRRDVLEIRLHAQMQARSWNPAADTARLLCIKASDEPEFFLRAAFCLHETGDTLAARNWLLKGPRTLFKMAVFHYNIACYLWTLGDADRARSHLRKAIAMDETFLDAARKDRDLAGIDPII